MGALPARSGRRTGPGLPWRAFGSATDVLAEWRSQNWWPVSACAVAAVASVLLALWCVRQATRGTRATVPLATRGAVTLRSALERAVTEEVLKTGEVVELPDPDHQRGPPPPHAHEDQAAP